MRSATELSRDQRAKLARILRQRERMETGLARLDEELRAIVRDAGGAAVARELGLSRQAVHQRWGRTTAKRTTL